MFEDLTLIGLLQKGGVTVVILGVFSVISLAIMLERAWFFHGFSNRIRAYSQKVSQILKQGGPDKAATLSMNEDSPLARVYLAGFNKRGAGRDEVLSAMELAGRAELARLDRFLGVLGTIGSTAPFVGLFGTVLGIIRAFSDLAVATGANPAAVANGIAEALVATATGLFVAVPAVMTYNYFVRRTSRIALELETEGTRLADEIGSR